MRKTLTCLVILSLFSFLLTTAVYAHSGCCSYHDGVRDDGCGCNDGTPLSSTCSPYYSCNVSQQYNAPGTNSSPNNTTNTYSASLHTTPTHTPLTAKYTPTTRATLTPTPKAVKKILKKNVINILKPTPTPQKSWWQVLFGI